MRTAGNGDLELFSEVLQVQHKVFYIDLKENARGRYFKIAERGKLRPKSTVVVPQAGVIKFIALFDVYLEDNISDGASKDAFVDHKVFKFSMGDNDQGRFLRVLERGGGVPAGGASLIIPMGADGANLRMFRDRLDRMAVLLTQLPPLPEMGEGLESSSPHKSHSPPAGLAAPPSEGASLETDEGGHMVLTLSPTRRFIFRIVADEAGGMACLLIEEVRDGVTISHMDVPLSAVTRFQEAVTNSVGGPTKPSLHEHHHHAHQAAFKIKVHQPPPPPPPPPPREGPQYAAQGALPPHQQQLPKLPPFQHRRHSFPQPPPPPPQQPHWSPRAAGWHGPSSASAPQALVNMAGGHAWGDGSGGLAPSMMATAPPHGGWRDNPGGGPMAGGHHVGHVGDGPSPRGVPHATPYPQAWPTHHGYSSASRPVGKGNDGQ